MLSLFKYLTLIVFIRVIFLNVLIVLTAILGKTGLHRALTSTSCLELTETLKASQARYQICQKICGRVSVCASYLSGLSL